MRKNRHTFGNPSTKEESPVKPLERDILSDVETNEIKETFKLFDYQYLGKINPIVILPVLKKLGIEQRNPSFFGMMESLAERNFTEVTLEEVSL